MENDENSMQEGKNPPELPAQKSTPPKIDTEYWKQQIENSESIMAYLKQFHPRSAEAFINLYVSKKDSWLRYGKACMEKNENEALQWETEAFKHLNYIQQKKLFDLQCLWRAEQIQVDDVQICFDFKVWEDDVMNCKFIDPVSESDIDLYSQYLLQENIIIEDDNWFYYEWQNYPDIKEAHNDSENADFNFPEWYEFHNNRTGAGVLMNLPDIRGEKESFYEKIFYENTRQEDEMQNLKKQIQPEERPWLQYYKDDFTEWFINTFEDKQTKEYYKAYTWNNRNNELEESLHSNIALLLTADEYVPIEANYNWIEALERACQKFRFKKIAEALPLAFERYLINLENNIQFPVNSGSSKSIRQIMLDNILKGRILNSEPPDLNF